MGESTNRRDRPPCLSESANQWHGAQTNWEWRMGESTNRRDRARVICTNSFIIGIALPFPCPSEKLSPNVRSQKSINESHHAQRASPFRNPLLFCNPLCRLSHVVRLQKRLNCWGSCTPLALCLAPRRMRAAFLNGSGSCTPLAYFFLLLKKSRSPHAVGTGVANASKATNNALGPNALEKRAMSVRVGVSKFGII